MIYTCARCGALIDFGSSDEHRVLCQPCRAKGWRLDSLGNLYHTRYTPPTQETP